MWEGYDKFLYFRKSTWNMKGGSYRAWCYRILFTFLLTIRLHQILFLLIFVFQTILFESNMRQEQQQQKERG